MIRNIRCTALLAALTISGLATMAPKAFADTQTVPFDGTVNSTCAFSNITSGKLGADLSTNTLDSTLTSSTATAVPGSSGGITVTCNTTTGASYKISSTNNTTSFTGAPTATSVTVNAVSSAGTSTASGTTSTTAGNSVTIGSTNPTPITIDLSAVYGSTLVAGTYSFDVVMEALP